jgi:hypothetical protein
VPVLDYDVAKGVEGGYFIRAGRSIRPNGFARASSGETRFLFGKWMTPRGGGFRSVCYSRSGNQFVMALLLEKEGTPLDFLGLPRGRF